MDQNILEQLVFLVQMRYPANSAGDRLKKDMTFIQETNKLFKQGYSFNEIKELLMKPEESSDSF